MTVHQWWGDGDSLGDITGIEVRCDASVHACNYADELCELVHVLGLSPYDKHVVRQVIDVVPHSLVGIKKCPHKRPGALGRVRMSASTHINEKDLVIHSFVCVSVLFYVPVCRPAVTDDCSARFDPVTKNSHQRVGGSVRKGN